MLKKIKEAVFVIAMLFVMTTVFSQKKVTNIKFDKMLSTLLSHNVPEIIPSEINEKETIVFLDSREKKEYKTSHIKNAIWVGYDTFNLSRVAEVPKGEKIIVYCSVGYRSEKIAEKLLKAGYTNVSNLYGGIFEWVHDDKKVYNKKEITKEVHTFNEEWSQWLLNGKKIY